MELKGTGKMKQIDMCDIQQVAYQAKFEMMQSRRHSNDVASIQSKRINYLEFENRSYENILVGVETG